MQIGGDLKLKIIFGLDPDNQVQVNFDGSAAKNKIIFYSEISKGKSTPTTFKQRVMSGVESEFDQSRGDQEDVKVTSVITYGQIDGVMNFVDAKLDISTATITNNSDFL